MVMNPRRSHESRVDGRSRGLLTLAAVLVGLAVVVFPLVGIARAEEADEKTPPVVRKADDARREGEARPRGERREGEREARPREERREGEREARPREERRRDGEGEGRGREGARGRGERGEGGRRRELRIPGELRQMMAAVKITEAQEQAIKKMLRAKEETLREWRKQNEPRIREAEQALRKAREALRRIHDEQKLAADKAHAKVLGVFTPQQRATWATAKVAKKMYERRGREQPLILSNGQLDDIDILAEKAAKELIAAEAKPADEARRAKQEILLKLQKDIYGKVLTDDQRRRAPRPGGLRGRGEEGEGRRVRGRGGEGEGGRERPRPGDGDGRREGEGERPRRRGDEGKVRREGGEGRDER